VKKIKKTKPPRQEKTYQMITDIITQKVKEEQKKTLIPINTILNIKAYNKKDLVITSQASKTPRIL